MIVKKKKKEKKFVENRLNIGRAVRFVFYLALTRLATYSPIVVDAEKAMVSLRGKWRLECDLLSYAGLENMQLLL